MISYALDHGVRKILFRPMRLFRDRHGKYMNAELLPTAKEYHEAASIIARLKMELQGQISIQSVPFEQTLYDSELGRPSRSFYLTRACYIGYVLAVIERDEVFGDVCRNLPTARPWEILESHPSKISGMGRIMPAFAKANSSLTKQRLTITDATAFASIWKPMSV